MQNDKFLNKDKTQAILDTRPAGVPINEALSALAKQGYTIEGYNDVSLAEKTAKAVGGFANELLKAPGGLGESAIQALDTNVAKPIGQYIAGKIQGTPIAESLKGTQPLVNAITTPQYETPKTAQEAAGMGLQTASYLIPYGKVAEGIVGMTGSKLLGQVGAGVTGGYATDVAQNMQENKSAGETLTPGMGTVIGAAIPTGFAGAQVAGRALQKTGTGLAGSVLPVNEREAGIIKSYLADKPFMQRVADVLKGTDSAPVTSGSTAVGQSLFGTKKMIGVQAERAQKNLWNDLIKPQLDNAKVQIDLPEYFNTVEKKIIEDTPELTRQKALLEALNSFKEDYAGMNTISLAKLQKLKEGWAEFVPEKFYKGQNIAGNARQVSALLADEARKTIYDVLGPEVKQAYFDYGNLMNLSKMGQTAMTGQKLKGGTGGLVSELISKAVTPVGTVGGNVIYKVGQGLEFIGKAGAKTLDEVLGLNNNQVLNNPINQQTTQSTANATKKVTNMSNTIPQTKKAASGNVKPKSLKPLSMAEYDAKFGDYNRSLLNKKTNAKIPKELQPLAEEASKYKSAEEFIKAQGEPLLHGTGYEKNIKNFKVGDGELGKGLYLTPNKNVAGLYGNKGKIYEMYLPKQSVYEVDNFRINPETESLKLAEKIISNNNVPETLKGITKQELAERISKTWDNGADTNKFWLEKAGYQALSDAKSQLSDQVLVFDPSQIKTKQQLIEIWNKANGKK